MPPKFPCGSCTIGVKYSRIKCTGPCNMWHHAGCQNIPVTVLKNNSESTTLITPNSPKCLDLLCNSTHEVESSLNENNFLENLDDNEEKLQLAKSLEEKVLNLEAEESKYISKIEDLLQNIAETQDQLEKEKTLRSDTQNIFEEHDSKQEQLIDDYFKMINHLQTTIKNLEKKISSQETKKSELLFSNGTQTEIVPQFTHQSTSCPSSFLVDRAQLKARQISLEQTVKGLTTQIQNTHTDVLSRSTIQTQNLRTIRNNLLVKPNKAPTKRGKKNIFSVSLKLAKCNEKERLIAEDLNQMTINRPKVIGGDCRTPPQKQKHFCMTQGQGQMTTDQPTMIEGDCQTPPQKQKHFCMTQGQGQMTTDQPTMIEGDCQTPPKNRNTSVTDSEETLPEVRSSVPCDPPSDNEDFNIIVVRQRFTTNTFKAISSRSNYR
ncbi:hypothetical protein J6590_025540 [Homalodisca vitripennis]|nr:hypothetical protein J6590_025540 [Homalodisca vitripennis]